MSISLGQSLHEETNGTARIINLRQGLSLYNLGIKNHPVNYKEYGDQFKDSTDLYLKEKMVDEANLSLESLVSDMTEAILDDYDNIINEFVIVKYTTKYPVRLIYVHVTDDYHIPEFDRIENNPTLDGTIYVYRGHPSVTINNPLLYDECALEHLSRDEYLKLIRESPIRDNEIIEEYTLFEEDVRVLE